MTRKIVRFLTCVLLLTFLTTSIFPAAKPEKKVDLKGFPEFVVKTMADWKVPGLAISIVKEGKVIFAGGFGFRDIEQGLKATPNTLFAIGSCTKAFTATAVGILVDEGKLEPAVKEIVFSRMPEKKMTEKSFLEKFVGKYEIQSVVVSVFLKGEKTLVLSAPGQPEYELVPYQGTEFNLKNLQGYSVESGRTRVHQQKDKEG